MALLIYLGVIVLPIYIISSLPRWYREGLEAGTLGRSETKEGEDNDC